MSSGLTWFRLYPGIINDDKVRLLAFEDRWHFVAICCLKASGVLDEPDPELRHQRVRVSLGLAEADLEKMLDRVARVKLIDRKTLEPLAWDRLQFASDSSKERVRAYRERQKRYGNVTVTVQEAEAEAEAEAEKTTAHERPKRAARALARAPDGVTESVWNDFKALRREHRAPVTATALAGIEREARKAGLSLDAALRVCCERGWRGFKADWVLEARASGNGSSRAARFVESLTKSRGVEDVESDVRRIA